MPLSRITNPFLSSSGAGNASITSPAANTLAFTTTTTERMRIDSSGNVGIGTASPSSFDATGRNLVVGSGSGNQGMTVYAGTTGYASVNFADGTSGSDRYAGQVSYDHTNNALLFATTTGTERMRIDSSGRMTMTSQPFFFATMSVGQTGYNATSSGDVVIIYNATTTNTGSHYNTANGKFTAPVAGNYIFYAAAYSSGTTFGQSWLVVNGSRGSYSTDWMNPTASNMAHGFWLIKLAANDTVGYHPYNSSATSVTIATNAEHTHFRGYLLS